MDLNPDHFLSAVTWKRAIAALRKRKWQRFEQDLGNFYRKCIYAPEAAVAVEKMRDAIESDISELATRAWALAKANAGEYAPLVHAQVLMDLRWLRIEDEFVSLFPSQFRAIHILPIYQAGLIPCIVAAGSYRFSWESPSLFEPSNDFRIEGA